MSDLNVSERMSWASNRKTTRAEDIAYCLGIFDVNMPLLYGEGGPRAFARLQEEIMKRTTDHTIFAWSHHIYGMPIQLSDFNGLWAPSPIYFNPGQSATPHHKDVSRREPPFQMTNKGLQIRLQFVSLPNYPGQFIALLNRYPPSLPDHRIGLNVRLRDINQEDARASLENGDTIKRLMGSTFMVVPPSIL